MVPGLRQAIEHQIRDLGWKIGVDNVLSPGVVELGALGPAAAFDHPVTSRVQR